MKRWSEGRIGRMVVVAVVAVVTGFIGVGCTPTGAGMASPYYGYGNYGYGYGSTYVPPINDAYDFYTVESASAYNQYVSNNAADAWDEYIRE